MATFGERMLGAARLDGRIYEEVERDTKADTQAIGVVVMSSVAAGLGAGAGLRGLIFGTVAALALWAIWAALVLRRFRLSSCSSARYRGRAVTW